MEIARTENIESEGLVKHYDSQDRLVKIEFARSGNSCTIKYPSVPETYLQSRVVTWNNGYRYFVYNKGDTTRFTEVKPNESVFGECVSEILKKYPDLSRQAQRGSWNAKRDIVALCLHRFNGYINPTLAFNYLDTMEKLAKSANIQKESTTCSTHSSPSSSSLPR